MTGIELIVCERSRQINVKGWSAEHDDSHIHGELLTAAILYATKKHDWPKGNPPPSWPWAKKWWKPSSDKIKNLVKAAALIAAEIDRLQRLATSPAT